MASTSIRAARALSSVWRRSQGQANNALRTLGRKGVAVPVTFNALRHSSTAAATSPGSEAPSSTVTPSSTNSTQQATSEAKGESEPVDADAVPFASLAGKVNPSLLKALTVRPFQYTTMSAVQSRILPMLPGLVNPRIQESSPSENESLDLLVKARTGTGKTIGFLVPAIEARIRQLASISSTESSMPSSSSPAAPNMRRSNGASHAEEQFAYDNVGTLVLSPTRELASQIAIESQKLTSHLPGFATHLFVGGVDKGGQIRGFRNNRKDVVVATPGRLRDFLQDDRSGVRQALKGCKMLILDEADTLLDMGFRDDIEDIITYLPSSAPASPKEQGRQTFLFSATVSPSIQSIARSTLHPNHSFVNCVPSDASEVHDHIPQYHTSIASPSHQLPHVSRLLVQDHLEHGAKSKVIVFLPTTKQTMLFSQIFNDLTRTAGVFPQQRVEVFELHSKRTMSARTRAAELFRRSSKASILVTSDVSARGVDYPGVTRVIQIGLPKSAEQYVHRVGRTGRGASKTGRGDLVLLDWEREFVRRNFSHLPLKPLSTADFASEVAEQAQGQERYQHVYADLERTLEEYLPQIDSELIGDSVASLAGFYAALAGPMGMSVDGVVEALKRWSTEGMGLAQAPYISTSLLQKLGGGRGDRSSRGSSRYGDRGDRQAARRSSERTANEYGRKREWRDDGERPVFRRREFDGQRSPFPRRDSFDSDRKPFQRRELDGERQSFQRPQYDENGRRTSFQRRDSFDGEKKPFMSRKPRGDSDGLFDF